MKKLMAAGFIMLVVIVGSVFAEVFIGSRQAGMGGAGVASTSGLNAVAYNPAGLMDGPSGELLLSLGGSSQGLDQLAQAVTGLADPSQFMKNNYTKKLDANGTVSGLFGFNFNHQALSLILPGASATLAKPANSLAGSFDSLGSGALVFTLGRSFATPGLPFGALSFGANAKAVSTAYGNLIISGNPALGAPVTATQETAQGLGYGFDVGAKANFQVPMLTDFSIGLVMQNISQSVKYKPKTRTDTYTFSAIGEPTLTKGPETEGAEITANSPSVTSLGCAGAIPAVGLKFAADLVSTSGGSGRLAASSESVTHLGLEYPFFLNALILRVGSATSSALSFTTLGAKINIPFLTLEIANVIDNKNSKNTFYTVDAGLTF